MVVANGAGASVVVATAAADDEDSEVCTLGVTVLERLVLLDGMGDVTVELIEEECIAILVVASAGGVIFVLADVADENVGVVVAWDESDTVDFGEECITVVVPD